MREDMVDIEYENLFRLVIKPRESGCCGGEQQGVKRKFGKSSLATSSDISEVGTEACKFCLEVFLKLNCITYYQS